MRKFSVRPTMTIEGRQKKGLRGLAGKPLHPPLTDVPVGAYLLAAVFDVVSLLTDGKLSHELFRAATFALIGGAVVSVFAAATGIADWAGSTSKGTQARRTANAHGLTMITVTVLVLISIALRLANYGDEPSTPVLAAVLTVVVAILTSFGGALGGTLVYDYGFNVETAGDSPVWHESETDVLPGHK